jgi:hypothetical protein
MDGRPVVTLAGRVLTHVSADATVEDIESVLEPMLGAHRECLRVVPPTAGGGAFTCLVREPRKPAVRLEGPVGFGYGEELQPGAPPDRSHPGRSAAFLRSLAEALAVVSVTHGLRRCRWSVSVDTMPGPTGAWLFVEVVPHEGKALTMVSFERPAGRVEGAAAQLSLVTYELEPLDRALVIEENIGLEELQDLAVHPFALLAASAVWLDEYIDGFGAAGCLATVSGRPPERPDQRMALTLNGDWRLVVGTAAP